MNSPREAEVTRQTKETDIALSVNLDGSGNRNIDTPLPFFNHMLDAFSKHGLFDLQIKATGDIEVDGHHLVEDVGLVLGDAFLQAMGDRRGMVRYGSFSLPMDETLSTVALDFCGRPAFEWRVPGISGKWVGGFDCDLAKEFFAAFASRAECNLHMICHYGENAHHILESQFKAFARAADAATQIDPRLAGQIPSTKGTLTA